MGLFGFGNKSKNVSSNVAEQSSGTKVDLLKEARISLDKSIVNLEKSSGMSFNGHKARVAVVMDYSGSMGSLYRDGSVQNMLTRLMPLALKFDDNGELDVWIFESGFNRIESMTMQNYATFVNREIMCKGYRMGGTSYAPVLKDVLRKYFVEDVQNATYPTFVIFVTDGENFDTSDTDSVIRESAKRNIFIEFVGIGDSTFSYLEKLDDLEDRKVDNTGFMKVSDMSKMSDETLFDKLLEQYPAWIRTFNK